MLCGGGYSDRSRPTGSSEVNPSGLLKYGKIMLQSEILVVKVHYIDAQISKSCATEEHQNNEQMDQAARMDMTQVDLDWEHKDELFTA